MFSSLDFGRCRRLAMRVILLVLAASRTVLAADLHVPADYPTIQAAVNAANVGDVVLVAPGTYQTTGSRTYTFEFGDDPLTQTHRAIAFLKSGVSIVSEAGSASTTLLVPEFGPYVNCLMIAQESTSFPTLVQGFTLQKPIGTGAALLAREMPLDWILTVEDCVFESSSGGQYEAGGLFCMAGGAVVVRRCRFQGLNSAGNYGALGALSWPFQPHTPVVFLEVESSSFEACPDRAIFGGASMTRVSGTRFKDCGVTHPLSPTGSAVVANTNLELEDCRFDDCTGTPVYINGGSNSLSTATLRRCSFFGCSGQTGAALIVARTSVVEDCRFTECTGTIVAGLWFNYNGTNAVALRDNIFHNVTSTGNFGAVACFAMTGEVLSNTFVGCASMHPLGCSALYASMVGPLVIEHNIFAGNGGNGAVLTGEDSIEGCNCFFDNEGSNANFPIGETSFIADPRFCDEANGDLTIRSDSPCAPPGPTNCGLVGAEEVGCGPVSVEASSWAKIKTLYR